MKSEPRFPIGTTFKPAGKHAKLETVIDILKTYNSKGELVGVMYLCEHEFLGVKVKTEHVDTTIARAKLAEREAKGETFVLTNTEA